MRIFNFQTRGFTLLEVLAALLILAIAMLGIYQGQSSLVRITIRSEKMAQALGLAQQKMSETEIEFKDKSLTGLKDEETGDFKDEALKEFKWKRTVDKVDVGCFLPKPPEGENGEGGDPLGGVFSLVEKALEENARKVKISVEWTEGLKKREISLTQLYINFKGLPSQ